MVEYKAAETFQSKKMANLRRGHGIIPVNFPTGSLDMSRTDVSIRFLSGVHRNKLIKTVNDGV